MTKSIKTYGSVCSGIEAASFVLEPLGIKPLWLSEIADFPKRFLSAKYPHIPNLEDMNDIPQMIEDCKIDTPDFLCGGTPCQAFSLAGWKHGLNDDRGQLTLKYIDILNAIDKRRIAQEQSRSCFMWENVEGVLKDKTNAFGFFLAGLLDLDEPIKCAKWPNAGAVFGKNRNIAWRVLDAKYFGVPQQRKRLYVLGGGKDFNPLDVLFEIGENLVDPYIVPKKSSQLSLFDDEIVEERPLTETINGHNIEVFRQYSDCLYAAYGTKWNGNAAFFNGSLFVCQDGRVRRLTPKECERLMGFPDDYTNIASGIRVTNRYQAIGNSWAVPVVSWVLNRVIAHKTPHIIPPKSSVMHSDSLYTLYFLNGFVASGNEWINASTYPYDYKLTHLLDVVDIDAEEKYYLSPAGCAGIVRRKIERNTGINERLEFHLRNGFGNNPKYLSKEGIV
ncbi:MAG: DNA cytosine methyltransferase [Lachnospiraceae bacterium]|nr:DNA cytosine methyltransferase [Lachnospiraceae bacterium]